MIFKSHFFPRELKKKFWDLKNISEISKIFEFTFLLDAASDRTLEVWHPGVVVMFENHFISLNWLIYEDFSFIKLPLRFQIFFWDLRNFFEFSRKKNEIGKTFNSLPIDNNISEVSFITKTNIEVRKDAVSCFIDLR